MYEFTVTHKLMKTDLYMQKKRSLKLLYIYEKIIFTYRIQSRYPLPNRGKNNKCNSTTYVYIHTEYNENLKTNENYISISYYTNSKMQESQRITEKSWFFLK